MTRVLPGLFLACCAAPLAAQEPATDLSEARRLLDERRREELHPSEDPLVIVGHAQGDNDLRARTPLLARAKFLDAPVDTNLAYERALAMYEGGARFHAPPEAPVHRPDADGAQPKARAEAAGAAAEELAPWWRSVVPVVVIAVLIVAYLYRRVQQSQQQRA